MSRLPRLELPKLELPKRTTSTGRGSGVDPILAGIVGFAVLAGGGLAAYGATQDTTPAAAPTPTVQSADPVVERALRIVGASAGTPADGDVASPEDTARDRARAREASLRGRGTDPFATPEAADPAPSGGSSSSARPDGGAPATPASSPSPAPSSSSGAPASSSSSAGPVSAVAVARRAASAADATTAAIARATGDSTASGGGSSADARTVARRLVAAQPARVTLRIATAKGKRTRSRRAIGTLVPDTKRSVARVVKVSASNRVVVLRLRSGARLTGRQSRGTMCIERLQTGDRACRLVRVRTGRTAVIRAPDVAASRRGPVTAVRVLSVWRGGLKLAD